MPSLGAALDKLASECEQIDFYSSQNIRPAGPFATAYLYLQPPGSRAPKRTVLNLIRDSNDSERKPYRFIGEETQAGSSSRAGELGITGGTGQRRVELREGHQLTPLKALRKTRGTGAEVDHALSAAEQIVDALVDSYRPMSRAKAHIHSLVDTHRRHAARTAELQALIAEASKPAPKAEAKPAPAEKATTPPPPLGIDEAIAAEEEALRALEANLKALRSQQKELRSSGPTPARGGLYGQGQQLQAPRTPREMPVVTNSLVNMTTPHRASGPPPGSKFSPLHLLGTPRAASSLRPSVLGADESRTIFARPPTFTPAGAGRLHASPFVATPNVNDSLVATPRPAAPVAATPVPVQTLPVVTPAPPTPLPVLTPAAAVPAPSPAPAPGVRRVEGVEVDLPFIGPSIDKIWDKLGDLMLLGADEPVDKTPEATIAHLHRLSRADPLAAPSSASVQSGGGDAPPITSEAILLSHLALMLLRSGKSSAGPNPEAFVPMPEAKSGLGAVCRARGWDGAEDLASKTIYAAVGRRAVRIDRRGGGGGKVRFAE